MFTSAPDEGVGVKSNAELDAMPAHMRDAWITAELIAVTNAAIRASLLDALRGTK